MTPVEFLRLEVWALLFLVGAVVGSFLNVCVYRIPLGLSVVRPRSACPKCGAAIPAWRNAPIASWILLRGKCADCRAPISVRYPLVELANALLWLAAAWRFGLTPAAFVALPFLSGLLALFFTDFDHQLLPDLMTLPLAAIGLALAAWNPRLDLAPGIFAGGTWWTRLAGAAAGAVVGYGLFFLLAVGWELFFKREAMGGGDLKLMLAVGAFLGVPGVVVTVFLGSAVGALISLPFLVMRRWTMRRELPFGCFLCPAAVVAALYGDALARWYLGFLS